MSINGPDFEKVAFRRMTELAPVVVEEYATAELASTFKQMIARRDDGHFDCEYSLKNPSCGHELSDWVWQQAPALLQKALTALGFSCEYQVGRLHVRWDSSSKREPDLGIFVREPLDQLANTAIAIRVIQAAAAEVAEPVVGDREDLERFKKTVAAFKRTLSNPTDYGFSKDFGAGHGAVREPPVL